MSRHRMILVGCGGMGQTHVRGFQETGRVDVCCVVDKSEARARECQKEFSVKQWGADFESELESGTYDFAVVATPPSRHAEPAIVAMEKGLDVYCEKPIASTLSDCLAMVEASRRTGRKLFIGHQLRYVKMWMSIVDDIRSGLLGFPIIMRMAGNQQTFDKTWETQKNLIRDTSPIVDCGTHYVNLMLAMNPAKPKMVCAMGTSAAYDVDWPNHYNYGLLQVKFENESVGYYEAGWGPMMTQNAWYIKDFSGPKGSLSVMAELDHNTPDNPPTKLTYTLHYRTLRNNSYKTVEERRQTFEETTGKAEMLAGAHGFFLDAIEQDRDITGQLEEAHNALEVVLAADRSVREGRMIPLGKG